MAAVLHIVGFFGAVFESEFALRFYSLFIFTFLAIVSIIATSWVAVAEERTMEFLRGFYRLYLESYYKEDSESFLDSFIDDVQRTNECCGYYTYPPDSEGHETYMKILYFLEMTNFGQKQASAIGWSSNALVNYVPRSCCVKPEAGCASDTYGSRLHWNATKAAAWKTKIHKIGCKDAFNNLWFLITNATVSMALLIEVLLTLIAVVLAYYCSRELRRNAMMVPSIERRMYGGGMSIMQSIFRRGDRTKHFSTKHTTGRSRR
ncbi:hypothetical protein M513_13668 [Trichuris suis]|uniref:Tetraspanin family protein n=1 Tax=Trichuris suis TaxID=68888 RepID=A0A085LKG1_9BILA|nr:hypothetical protein M513_13668 [Trichuris suis]